MREQYNFLSHLPFHVSTTVDVTELMSPRVLCGHAEVLDCLENRIWPKRKPWIHTAVVELIKSLARSQTRYP